MTPAHAVPILLLSMLMAVGTAAAPAFAQTSVNIAVAPPAARDEIAPYVAPGYLWAPGYWAWHGDHHDWIRGHTIVQRFGYRWDPDRWEQRDLAYYRHPGAWVRDPGYQAVDARNDRKPGN